VKPILIVDYGMANLRSVQKAFEKVGAPAIISDDPNHIAETDKLVLPGVVMPSRVCGKRITSRRSKTT